MNKQGATGGFLDRLRWFSPDRSTAVLLGVALVSWLIVLLNQAAPYAGGADSSGYLNNARLLQEGSLEEVIRPLPELSEANLPGGVFEPLGFRADAANDTLEPTYPFGFPLVLALFQSVLGAQTGVLVVMILLGLAAPWTTWQLGRETGLSVAWSAFGAITILAGPIFRMQAFFPMTDVFTLVIANLLLISLLRMSRNPWSAYAVGGLLALGVLTRPANVLLFLPVIVHLLFQPGLLRQVWKIGLGGLPGAVFLGWINFTLYDKILTTSYGNFSHLFQTELLLPSLLFFLLHAFILLSPPAVLGLLGSPLILRAERNRLPALLALVAAYLIFYAFYFHASEYWWSLRFILPTFGAIVVLGAQAWSGLLDRYVSRSAHFVALRWIPLLFAFFSITLGRYTSTALGIYDVTLQEQSYADAATWLAENADPDDVIVCMQTSGSVFYYLDNPIVRWDMLTPDRWSNDIAPRLQADRRILAVLFPFENSQGILVTHVPGNWELIEEIILVSVFEWVPLEP